MAKTTIWDGSTDGDWGTAGNWSNGVPVSTDTIIIPADVTQGIVGGDYSAVLLAACYYMPGSTVTLGTKAIPLHLDCDLVDLAGTGLSYLQIDNSAEINVRDAKGGTSTVPYGLNLTGATNTKLTIEYNCGGSIGVAANDGETGTFTTIVSGGLSVQIGTLPASVTATTLTVTGGVTTCYSSIATIVKYGGKLYAEGAMAVATSYSDLGGDGTEWNSSGTVTQGYCNENGSIDFNQDSRAKTWTDLTCYSGASISDHNRVVTWTNAVELVNCTLADCNIDFGLNRKLTVASI